MTQDVDVSSLERALCELPEMKQLTVTRTIDRVARTLRINIPFISSLAGQEKGIGNIPLVFVLRIVSIADPSGSSIEYLWDGHPAETATYPVLVSISRDYSSYLEIVLPTQADWHANSWVPIGTVPVWFIKQVIEAIHG